MAELIIFGVACVLLLLSLPYFPDDHHQLFSVVRFRFTVLIFVLLIMIIMIHQAGGVNTIS